MEKCTYDTEFQNITKHDLQLLAKVIYDWSNTNFQVIELEELSNVRYHKAGERFTLIINIKNQWNTFIKDKNNKTYLGYTDANIRDNLLQVFKANSFKKPHTVKIYNHGISAIINVTVINGLLDNAQAVNSIEVKKWDTIDSRVTLTECLRKIHCTHDIFKSLHNQCFNSQRYQPEVKVAAKQIRTSDKKVDLNQSSEIKAIKRTQNELQAMETSATPPKISKPSPGGAKASLCTDVVSLKVVIRNEEPMNYDQMAAVHECIKKNILLLEENQTAPKFLGYTFEHGGSVIITCENPESMQWLLEVVPRMKPWTDAELSIKSDSELRNAAIFRTYIPGNEVKTVEMAFCLIKKQNPEINSEQWWVLKGTKNKNGFIMTIAMNEICAKALQKNKYSVAIGGTSIKFRAGGVHTRFSQRKRLSDSDLQSEKESLNETVSPLGGKKRSTSKTPCNKEVPGPSMDNNKQRKESLVTATLSGGSGYQARIPMSPNSDILNEQIDDMIMNRLFQFYQRLSQSYK